MWLILFKSSSECQIDLLKLMAYHVRAKKTVGDFVCSVMHSTQRSDSVPCAPNNHKTRL